MKLFIFLALFFSAANALASEPVHFQLTYHFPNQAQLIYRVNDVSKANNPTTPDTVLFLDPSGTQLWSFVTELSGMTASQYQVNPNVSLKPETKVEVASGILRRTLGERKFTMVEGNKGDVVPTTLRVGSPFLVNSLGEVTSVMVDRDYALENKWTERFFMVADELYRAAISEREIVFIRNSDQRQALFNTHERFVFDHPAFKDSSGGRVTIFDLNSRHGLSFTANALEEDQTALDIRMFQEKPSYQSLKAAQAASHQKSVRSAPVVSNPIAALMVSDAVRSAKEQQEIDAFAQRLIAFGGDSAKRIALYGEYARFAMGLTQTGTMPSLRSPSPEVEDELASAITYDLVGRPDLAIQFNLALPSRIGSGFDSTSSFVSQFLRSILELTAETKGTLLPADFETLLPLVDDFTDYYVSLVLRLFEILPQHPSDFETELEFRLATRLVQMSSHLLFYEEVGTRINRKALVAKLNSYLKVQPEESAAWFSHSAELKLIRQKVRVALLAKDPQSQIASHLVSQKDISLDDIEKVVALFPRNEGILRKAADRALELLDVRKQSLLDQPGEFKDRFLLNQRVLKLVKAIYEETQDHSLSARLAPYTQAFETNEALAIACEQTLSKIK